MKLAIVTGGSRGLGAALCTYYKGAGWEVMEFSRSKRFPYSIYVDLSEPEFAMNSFMQGLSLVAGSELSEVVAFSNAAMLGPVGPVEHSSPADIAEHINVNVVSATLFACGVFAAFGHRDCPKTFVNISSGAATRGLAGWSLYCSSKAAMENYVRAVALEQRHREHPIRAISVNPGVMDTRMQEEVRQASAADFPDVEHYVQLRADGRLADPSQVAQRIAELVASRPEAGQTYSIRR